MASDLYTKGVLTVIAICLAIIVFRGTNIVSRAQAAADVVAVKIVGVDLGPGQGPLPVEIQKIAYPIHYPLPVEMRH